MSDIDLSCKYNCNPKTGGSPICRLGQINDFKYRNKNIQIKGAYAREVVNKYRDGINRKCSIMLIGEAPGFREDELNMPFVGDAGDILSEFLTGSDLDLDDIFVSNTVRCRPPKNRKPSVQEIKTCLTHTYDEIREFQPEVIMLLGAVPLRIFNLHNLGGITKIRGQLFEKKLPYWPEGPTFKVIPTFHPASFLYTPDDGGKKARVLSDFRFAKQILNDNSNTRSEYKTDYTVADNLESVKSMVNNVIANGSFAFDTESPDLNFMDSPMRLLQVSIGKGQNWVIPFYKHNPDALGKWKMDVHFRNGEREKVTDLLKIIFENNLIEKIGANIKYDINVIKRWLGIEIAGRLWDIQCLHHLLHEYPSHSLEYLSDIELGTGDYSYKVREIVGHGKNLRKSYDHIPDEVLYPYGAIDAESSYRLKDIYQEALEKKPHLLKVYEEETHDLIRTLGEAEWVGNYIIVDNVNKLEEEYTRELQELTNTCRKYTTPDFNPGSPKQVQEALVSLGFAEKIYEPTTASGYSVAKDILIEINHPLADAVVKYRNRQKLLTTYVNNVLEDLSSDGRVRHSFNINGTTNGRLSCRFLQQIPRIDEDKAKSSVVLRSIFGEEEGYLYFYADFSQIELRVFAYLTGEKELIETLESGGDIHKLTAAAALGIDPSQVSPFNRALGKTLNFGVIYGSQGYKISKEEFENPRTGRKEIVGDRAFDFVKNFRKRYTKIDDFLERIPEEALCNGGILRMVFGRERRIHGLNDPDNAKRAHAEREATNAAIQGPAGAITLRTMNRVRQILLTENINLNTIRLLNTVHDSMAYGVKSDYIDWFTPKFREIAERPIPELQNKSFPVKIGIGKTWTEAELNAK